MITASALHFFDQPVVIQAAERREIAEVVREFAGRLLREKKPSAKKRGRRFDEIARALRTGEVLL